MTLISPTVKVEDSQPEGYKQCVFVRYFTIHKKMGIFPTVIHYGEDSWSPDLKDKKRDNPPEVAVYNDSGGVFQLSSGLVQFSSLLQSGLGSGNIKPVDQPSQEFTSSLPPVLAKFATELERLSSQALIDRIDEVSTLLS